MTTIEEFKNKLQDATITDLDIVQGCITPGSAFAFQGDDEKYFKLKKRIALEFGLNPQKVIMVGSAKLGFSISPGKLWQPFNDDSDIDMAIISPELFDRFWKELYDFNIDLTSRSEKEDKQYRDFLSYFFRGWLRPDMFPFSYEGRAAWFEFFKSISYGDYGNHKVTGAIFRNDDFYESYQTRNIRNIRAIQLEV